MQVGRWGNSLAVRLPAAVVEALGLTGGDEIEIALSEVRRFEVSASDPRASRPAGCCPAAWSACRC
jgi:antitoxin MazE